MLPKALWASWLIMVGCTIASPVTFELRKGEKECFYTLTTDIDCSISYYFTVQQGPSNANIAYEIFGPADKYTPIIQRRKERQGKWSFSAEHKGEYKFCFDGGEADKMVVDLEIKNVCKREDDARSNKRIAREKQRNLRVSETDPLKESLENYVDQIERRLYQLENTMDYYKVRNSRNHHTVHSTGRRIVTFSVYGILLIALMGLGQVAVLQYFFQKARKQVV